MSENLTKEVKFQEIFSGDNVDFNLSYAYCLSIEFCVNFMKVFKINICIVNFLKSVL